MDIKSCPFCGGEASTYKNSFAGHVVKCNEITCGAHIVYPSKGDGSNWAVDKWNLRHDDRQRLDEKIKDKIINTVKREFLYQHKDYAFMKLIIVQAQERIVSELRPILDDAFSPNIPSENWVLNNIVNPFLEDYANGIDRNELAKAISKRLRGEG